MEIPVTFEERHRTNEGEMAFGALFTRIVAAGKDIGKDEEKGKKKRR